MKRPVIRFIAVVLMLCLVSACATMSDTTATKAQGAGVGAAAGAAIGTVVALLTGNKKALVPIIATTTAIGAGLGFWWGSTVAQRKKEYINQEAMLDGEIKVFAGYNQNLQKYNDEKTAQIRLMDQEVANLNSRYRSHAVQWTALQAKKNEINKIYCEGQKCSDHMYNELTALSNYQKSINGTEDPQKVAKLNREIAALKQNIAMLDTNNRQLARLQNSLAGVRK